MNKVAKFFFSYLNPVFYLLGVMIVFLIANAPGEAQKTSERRIKEGEAVYCSRMVTTDKINEDGFKEFRCFKDEKK